MDDLKYLIWTFLLYLTRVYGVRGPLLHPSFLNVPKHHTFNRGESALLLCAVENLATKSVIWRKIPYITPITAGAKLFAQDTRFGAVHVPWKKQWNLSIKNVQPQDAGIYECQVGTRGKKLRQNITLSVIDVVLTRKPGIKISGTEFPDRGSTIFLLCNATGRRNPPNNIKWFRNGKHLYTDVFKRLYIKNHVAVNAAVLTSSLQIENATKEDNGIYICKADLEKESMLTRMNVIVLNAGSSYAKRGTINHTSKPERTDLHDVAVLFDSTSGLISFLIFIQIILQVLVIK